ncbi:MAG: T9SS type A sorting domain-containing protein [Melioribacter sp.]|nr:T9SS type A sorting domain-containing protein [Melioribacter sp.]
MQVKKDGFVYRSTNPITMVENFSTTQNTFQLSQNYPNPFNPVTTIEYSIPQKEKVKLAVYNILGKLVSILIDDYQNAGSYKIKFYASNLSSGIYFYRIIAGIFTQTKQMLLLK